MTESTLLLIVPLCGLGILAVTYIRARRRYRDYCRQMSFYEYLESRNGQRRAERP